MPLVLPPTTPATGALSIVDYGTLQTAVLAWLKRPDKATSVPDFIGLAEQNIARNLHLRAEDTSTSGTTSSDTIAFSPAAMGRIERVELTSDSSRYTLDYTSPNGIEPLTISTGLPSRYTVEGNAVRIIPAPDSAYSYKIFYTPNLSPLNTGNTVNWILTNAPDVYLYGALWQAYLQLQDDPNAQKWQQLFMSAMSELNGVDEAKRFPISGGLQIKPRSVR